MRVAQRLVDEAAPLDESVAPLGGARSARSPPSSTTSPRRCATTSTSSTSTPAHRDALELRYDKLKALMRKYGGSADEVLAYAEEARARLAALEEFAADEESLVGRVDGGAGRGARRRRAA